MRASLRQRVLRRFLLAGLVLLALLIVGAIGYRALEGMSLVDGVYMVVLILSTVGFGEIHPLSPAGRVFTMLLIVTGVGLAAYTVSGMAAWIGSGEWRAHWQQQKQLRMLAKLSGHVIVCGYGRVGRHVADELRAEGLPLVVIDPDPAKIARIEQDGYLALQGSGADENELREAGIERARSLVAAANSDAQNVYIALTARGLRDDLLIVVRANEDNSEPKLLRAGANRVVSPYSITGKRMVTMMVRPDVSDFLDEVTHAGGLELLLEQVSLAPASSLVGKSLTQAHSQNVLGVTVLALKLPDGRLETRPHEDIPLQAGTQIVALGTREQLQQLIDLASG